MTSYKVLATPEIKEFLRTQGKKTRRIVKENLEKLEEVPYPGEGLGGKEKLPIEGDKRYRMHIGRT